MKQTTTFMGFSLNSFNEIIQKETAYLITVFLYS